MQAIFGRRSRRFGLGMEIPSGPLAFKSQSEPYPLSEQERAILVTAATGVSGWNFGVPFSPSRPTAHANATVRFTGRTAPTAAGIGTPVVLHSDDSGSYLTNTRDVMPDGKAATLGDQIDVALDVSTKHTVELSSERLDLPSVPPHMLEPNTWMANAPGSTLLLPIADASEQFLGLLAIFLAHGYVIMDTETNEPAGQLGSFLRSGLLDEDKPFPLSMLQQITYEANCSELAFMAHNAVLTMQAMGLGGLYFSGVNRWSVLGAFVEEGINGLGFRMVSDGGRLPNPVGIDGVFEALCPPYYRDMRAAVEVFVEHKFGPRGAYDPKTTGPWRDSSGIKGGVDPYSSEFVACLGEIAQYVYDRHGKFPGTVTTIVLPGLVQAHHIDTDYYDAHFMSGAYLDTHATHMERWHSERPPNSKGRADVECLPRTDISPMGRIPDGPPGLATVHSGT